MTSALACWRRQWWSLASLVVSSECIISTTWLVLPLLLLLLLNYNLLSFYPPLSIIHSQSRIRWCLTAPSRRYTCLTRINSNQINFFFLSSLSFLPFPNEWIRCVTVMADNFLYFFDSQLFESNEKKAPQQIESMWATLVWVSNWWYPSCFFLRQKREQQQGPKECHDRAIYPRHNHGTNYESQSKLFWIRGPSLPPLFPC